MKRWISSQARTGRQIVIWAHDILARDSTASARTVATLVLANFADRDSTWHALAASLTDPDPRIGSVARNLFDALSARRPMPVDWSGARESLAALLDGTATFHFANILQVLRATEIDPGLGAQLARQGPDLLLTFAGAEHKKSRDGSLEFLQIVSGEDFGRDVDAWREWLRQG